MNLNAEVRESLTSISDAALDRVTASSSVFFDRRWFRMLDAIDLAPLVRGEVALRYVVVSRDMEPVGICPFVVTRSKSIYWYYSLDKFFFSSWQDKLLRENPARGDWIRKVSRIVAAYRGFARATGVRTDGWVLAVSPLSYRGDIALAAMTEEDEQLARQAVIGVLQEVAKDEKLPLCFFGVQEDKTELRRALAQQGFVELFLAYDHLLHVSGQSFADYLDRFRSDARRHVSREIKLARNAGVRFEITQNLGDLSARMAELYESTSSKYGEEHFDFPASFWAALERYIVPQAEAVIAYSGREPIGFSLLLNKQHETWFYFVGRSYEGELTEAPVYFNLAVYEPVKRVLALGAERLWLGVGGSATKRRRGATGHPLYSCFWFPRRWDRAVLLPYLERFSQVNRRLQGDETVPSSYLKAQVAGPASRPELHTASGSAPGPNRTRSGE
jgi:uncharacterized protein